MTDSLWPPGTATAIGSLPGVDPVEAARIVLGELPDLPHLPELPARGVGADMVGRAAALLVDLAVELVPSGYRITARPGRDHRRAQDLLRIDLDALDEAIESGGIRPKRIKVQTAGPWTTAASVELPRGHRLLTDPGALRDLVESQAEGLARHVHEISARTGASVVVQFDEPSLPAVLAGTLRTPSGLSTVPAVAAPEAQQLLARSVAAAKEATGEPVIVHCCADDVPLAVLRAAGAEAIAIDLARVSLDSAAALDAIGETWDSGATLLLGLVPGVAPEVAPTLAEALRPATDLVDRLGFPRSLLAERAVPTPACGLAGATTEWSRRAMDLVVDIGRAFVEPLEQR